MPNALQRDLRGRGQILVVVERHDTSSGEGAELRYRGLVAGLRNLTRVDVLSLDALREDLGCAAQCTDCSMLLLPNGRRPPYDMSSCSRTMKQVAAVVRGGAYRMHLVSHLPLHRYVQAVRAESRAPLVVDLHNAEADLYEDMVLHPRARQLRGPRDLGRIDDLVLMEGALLAAADVVTVPSAQDRTRLRRRYGPGAPVVAVPNAVRPGQAPGSGGRPARLVFVGALNYYPNVLAAVELCESIAPAVRARHPQMEIMVVGRSPGQAVVDAARASGVALVADPPDIRPFLRDAILAVPLTLGGGTRLKILEALGAGTPVISTRKGIEGIAAEAGRHYLPAETPGEFAAAVSEILDDPAADLRRRQAGYELVHSTYSWDALASPLREVLRRAGADLPAPTDTP
ncbi:glycosyltransferase family 4 protein [Streptomyces sp. SS8]